VKGISDLINIRGLINLDFADIRTVMQARGLALMGTGAAKGENRAVEAATAAISSPLLENIKIEGATGIIINVTGGPDLSLYEVNEASTLITEAAHEDAEIIFGAVIDPAMGDEVRVTVIATGFADPETQRKAPDSMLRMQEFLNPAPPQAAPRIELPPMSSFQQYVQTMAPVQQPQAPQVSQPSAPAYQAEVPETLSPVTPAPMQPGPAASRDALIAKVRAFRENQQQTKSAASPEQLSMDVEPAQQQSLEDARRMAREVLSSPFANQSLEVPAFIRKRQGMENLEK
jgi:cell division protein FtsZ